MDSPQPPQPISQSKRLRTGIIIVALALLAAVLFGIVRSSKNPPPEPPLLWLDQTQFARQMQPGRLKRLYYKVVHLTAPVWQRLRRPKTHIQIASKILAVHGLSTGDLSIGAASATNNSGTQVWILSAAELNDLRQRLPTNRFEVVSAPSIITADGLPASIFSGQVLPQTSASIGVSLYISPKIASHEFQFAINAVYTEQNDSPTLPIRTNISAACRVRLPNAGGVLITSPTAKDAHSTNYWLILSPTAIDAYGKPIKL